MAKLFLLEELSEAVKIPAELIVEWDSLKLIKAAGYTEDKIPYFTEEASAECEVIQSLVRLGYEPEDIIKIKKKVGMPRSIGEDSENKLKHKLLTVGELAERIGVSTRTIKHWEDKGIIESDMRSEGGFRLYSEQYIYLCSLIQDLQNFGYSLDEIKVISDYFRDFLAFESSLETFDKEKVSAKLELMFEEIEQLLSTMSRLKQGISRWEELLKNKKKEVTSIKNKNNKRVV